MGYLTSIAPTADRGSPVPRDSFILVVQREVPVSGFVGLDEVRQDGAEARVIVTVDVLVGTLDDLTRVRVTNIARLSVIIP
jgi:hypothetical protein